MVSEAKDSVVETRGDAKAKRHESSESRVRHFCNSCFDWKTGRGPSGNCLECEGKNEKRVT